MTNIIASPVTSICYIGSRKSTDRARNLLKKAVLRGVAPKPDNTNNLFRGRAASSAKLSKKPLFAVPGGLFMTDDAGVPARLSAAVPVLVMARSENTRTSVYFRGHKIF